MALIALTKTSTEFGEISRVQSRVAGSHVYWQEGRAQSEADRNGVSLAAYVHAIFGLVAQTADRGALMIGCGGGTLGTMLDRAVHTVTVVDINPQSIALAQPEVLQDEIAAGLQAMRFRGGRRSWNLRTADESDCPGQIR